ncbi:MAG: disulfide bond formation protein B [Gammaproteobacteria bacterium]
MHYPTHPARPVYLALVIFCTGLLSYGYYLQFAQGLEPCPLCILQRLAFIGVLLFCLLGLLHGPGKTGVRLYSSLAAISAALGIGIAARQVWLQHLPTDQVPDCGPGLEFMLQAFPLSEAIQMILKGSGECAEVDWLFLSMSIAEWSLACFILLLIVLLTHIVGYRGTPS